MRGRGAIPGRHATAPRMEGQAAADANTGRFAMPGRTIAWTWREPDGRNENWRATPCPHTLVGCRLQSGSPPFVLNNTRERQGASRRSAGNHRRQAPCRSRPTSFNRNGGEPKQMRDMSGVRTWIIIVVTSLPIAAGPSARAQELTFRPSGWLDEPEWIRPRAEANFGEAIRPVVGPERPDGAILLERGPRLAVLTSGRTTFICPVARTPRPCVEVRGEPVMFSPQGLSQWFNGFFATRNSREIRVEQKPLNHRRKVGGETITRSERLARTRRPCYGNLANQSWSPTRGVRVERRGNARRAGPRTTLAPARLFPPGHKPHCPCGR